MNDLRKAAEDLLEVVLAAIKAGDWKVDGACDPESAIVRLRQALNVDNVDISEECVHKTDKSIHEPVAWMKPSGLVSPYKHGSYQIPLYTTPLKWVGLTDEEVDEIYMHEGQEDVVLLTQAKLKEKNVPQP